jgi:ribose transport system permease protein
VLRKQWALLVLVVLVAIFSILRPEAFMSVANAKTIAVNASAYLIIAVGMTFVITVAGIDLSVGSVLVFAGVISVKVMVWLGGDGLVTVLVGLVAALAAGLAWGAVNGIVVSWSRVPALIVTLGSYSAAYGASLIIAKGVDLGGVPPSLVDTIGFGELFGIAYTIWIALLVAGLGALVMTQTRFGRHTCAIGSNEQSAVRAAIDVKRHVAYVYALSGLLAGLAGYVSLARFSTTTINGHQTDMLQAILAVVIGGTSLAGGVGRVLGTVVGVCIPAVLQDGLVIMGIQPFWQQISLGVALVAVVYVDQRRRLGAT